MPGQGSLCALFLPGVASEFRSLYAGRFLRDIFLPPSLRPFLPSLCSLLHYLLSEIHCLKFKLNWAFTFPLFCLETLTLHVLEGLVRSPLGDGHFYVSTQPGSDLSDTIKC